MADICSVDAEVSSTDAACSEAPCASCWLAEEICTAALDTWREDRSNSLAARLSTALLCRITNKVSTPAIRAPMNTDTDVHHAPLYTDAASAPWRARIRFCRSRNATVSL